MLNCFHPLTISSLPYGFWEEKSCTVLVVPMATIIIQCAWDVRELNFFLPCAWCECSVTVWDVCVNYFVFGVEWKPSDSTKNDDIGVKCLASMYLTKSVFLFILNCYDGSLCVHIKIKNKIINQLLIVVLVREKINLTFHLGAWEWFAHSRDRCSQKVLFLSNLLCSCSECIVLILSKSSQYFMISELFHGLSNFQVVFGGSECSVNVWLSRICKWNQVK